MRKFRIPHVFVFLFWIILVCAVLSYFVPSGSFERTTRTFENVTQTVVVPGSYAEVLKHMSIKGALVGDEVEGMASPTSLLGILEAIPKGLAGSAVLIFYVFIIGAVFTLLQGTGAINALLFALMARFRNRPVLLFFLIYMLLFTASSFMGIAPETIPLIPVFLYLAKRMGYDRMFGIGLVAVPVFLGWSTGVTNPFTVQVAQMIAELPIGSGIGFRFVLYLVCSALGFLLLMRYGAKVKKNPVKGLMHEDRFDLTEYGRFEEVKMEGKHIAILLFFSASYAAILIAVQTIGWGLIEMSAGFIGISIVVTFLSGMSGDESMASLTKGLEIMIVPALIVGVARGISVVLQEAMIIDTILNHASAALMTLPRIAAAEGMLIFQSTLNFFIPSASGQALVSMPLLTPLADVLGISRQTAVLAFILGDGLSNMIIPTNGILMAMLGVAHIPFGKWIKFVMPIFLTGMVVATIFMAVAVWIGY